MRILIFLLVSFLVGNLFAQQGLLKDTNYFDYWTIKVKNNKNGSVLYPENYLVNSNVSELDSRKEIELIQLGNVNDGFKCIGFKIHPKDLLKSSSGRGLIPIMHYNLDQTNSVVDFNIYISQKIKKRWLKSEKRFERQKELIELTYDGSWDEYFQSIKGQWNQDVIELPRDLDSNKFIWVFFTLKNQDEEIALYFPNEIKQLKPDYFKSEPAFFTLGIYDNRQKFDSLLTKNTDSLVVFLKSNYNLPNTKIRLIKDYWANNLYLNYSNTRVHFTYDRLAIVEKKLREIGISDIEQVTLISNDIEKTKSPDRINIYLKSEELPEHLYQEYDTDFFTFIDEFNSDSSFQKRHIKDELNFIIDKGYDFESESDLIDTLYIHKNELNFLKLCNVKTNLFNKNCTRTINNSQIFKEKMYLSLYYEEDENLEDSGERFINLEHNFQKIDGEWFLFEVNLRLEETDKKEQKKIVKNYFLNGNPLNKR